MSLAAILLVGMVAGDLPPADIGPPKLEEVETPEDHKFPVLGCDRGICLSFLSLINGYVTRYSETVARAEKAERERDALRKSCAAKLEVTEPPKKVPNFKLEKNL